MTTRRNSPRTIDQLMGPIVLRYREGEPAPRVADCTNVGVWTGSACMMPAESGTDRCKLHPRDDA